MAAGAKGENGDTGKPGVTPLDSCDMVRPGGNWEDIVQHPVCDSPRPKSCDPSLLAASLAL